MTEAIFLDRRTRSQLTLPDNVIQKLSQRSPLKHARTALRNHATAGEAESEKDEDDSTDDELLLSPGKNEMEMRGTQRSKRSASPPPKDEYLSRSGSPSSGRERKRVRRDPVLENGQSDVENVKVASLTHQRTIPGHARNQSEPNIRFNRRSARKYPATTSTKPISTVSEGTPPPPHFSPAVSPTKGRAQSVPLFPSTQDVPRIDFRNIPSSPRRARSPPRSPSKDREPKLRITSGPFPVVKLFTIQDEAPADVDMGEDASSVAEEREMPLIQPTAPEERPSSVAAPNTNVSPPTPSTSSIHLKELLVPATPASQSLNSLIPMSPLTPLPETPFVAKHLTALEPGSRYASTTSWDTAPPEPIGPPEPPKAASSIVPVLNQSRLPRPSAVPTPAKPLQKPTMGPPPATTAKKAVNTAANPTVAKKEPSTAPKENVFDILMKGSQEQKERRDREKEKEKLAKVKKSATVPSSSKSTNIFASVTKETEKTAELAEGSKMRMKDKMRLKGKMKETKAVQFVPTSDGEEEEQEQRPEATTVPWPVGEHVPESEPTPGRTPEPIETSPPVVNDTVMEPLEENGPEEPVPLIHQDATMKVVGGDVVQDEEHSGDVLLADMRRTPGTIPPTLKAPPAEITAHSEETLPVTAKKDDELKDEDQSLVKEPASTQLRSQARSGPSKLPLGKKRQPIFVAPANRVTRSVSSRKNGAEGPQPGPSRKKAAAPVPVPSKRTASGSVKNVEKKKPAVAEPLQEPPAEPPAEEKEPVEDEDLLPGSPMRMSSPAKMVTTPNKTAVDMTPTKSRFDKLATPSPSKIARATSLFSKPAHKPRTWSMDFSSTGKSTSSLSTLSNALEKLRMPPPARPSTSMGFNRDTPGGDADDADGPSRSQDDGTVGRTSLGVKRTDTGLKRHATVGAGAFKGTGKTSKAVASSSKVGEKALVQKPLSMFLSNKGQSSTLGGAIMRGTGRTGALAGKTPIFGLGGGVRRTISKKTSLPMVVGSPVRGGAADTTMREYEDDDEDEGKATKMNTSGDGGDVFMAPANQSTGTLLLEDLEVEVTSAKGKEKEKERPFGSGSNASRRVSMVSHALSQSLSALPLPETSKPRRLMGPPAAPPSSRVGGRSTSSSYPSSSSNKARGNSSSPAKAEGSGTRSSARLAKTVPKAVAQIRGADGVGPSSKKAASASEAPLNPAAEALKVLKDCVIFVDVKTDEGDEAGSLFVEMLEGVGARVLTRVGQTCTHVVYKNGLMSTVTRYRLLRDPKPFVVGIGWVVECVEQRKRVDETDFLVDLEGVNVAGTHKRRRSMLPKLLSNDFPVPMNDDNTEDGDQSMDGSHSSFTMDDGLAPLERARKRKNMLTAGGRL